VRPNETVVIGVELPPLPAPGTYRVVVDMVHERVVWFADMGSPPLETEVVVTPVAQAKAQSQLK
jgi:hypothetical protein